MLFRLKSAVLITCGHFVFIVIKSAVHVLITCVHFVFHECRPVNYMILMMQLFS